MEKSLFLVPYAMVGLLLGVVYVGFTSNKVELNTYEKAGIIQEERANDRHCQSGNEYEKLCHQMYDQRLEELIKNDHVRGN